MSVIVSIQDSGAGRKEVKISVPAPAVAAETQRVAGEYRKRARIPGFRKGKVPASVIQQRFGEDIEREVTETLIPRYWSQAEAEAQLDLLMPPELGAVDQAPGEDLTFVARVDVAPEFELRNVSDFELPDPAVEPAKEEVQQALEDVRRELASFVEVERPAAQGDRIKAKIREKGDPEDQAAEPPEAQEVTFEIGDAQVWEELSLAATGRKVGQKIEFERSEAPGDEAAVDSGAEPGPARYFEGEISSVSERELSPLNDAFASSVGKFETLAELEADIAHRLRQRNSSQRRRERERALLDQLVERHPFEISERVVQHEVEQMLGDYANDLARQGVDVEKAGMDWQKLGEQMTPQAERRVKARLILDQVAREQGVTISEEELEAALSVIGRAERRSSGSVRQALDKAGRLAPFKRQLVREKTVNRLLGEETPSGEESAVDEGGATDDKGEEE